MEFLAIEHQANFSVQPPSGASHSGRKSGARDCAARS